VVQTLYLQTEVELLERSPYLGRKPVHAFALLERDDHVRSPVFHRNLGHYLLHDERVWQTADDVVQDRFYLHVENNERDITWPRSFLASVRRYKKRLISGACSTAHRSNIPDHWDGLCSTGQLLDNFHPSPVEQNGSNNCRQVCWSQR